MSELRKILHDYRPWLIYQQIDELMPKIKQHYLALLPERKEVKLTFMGIKDDEAIGYNQAIAEIRKKIEEG